MIVNLCPHPLNIFLESGSKLEIPTSGTVARVSTVRVRDGAVSTFISDDEALYVIPTFRITYGEVTGLPSPVEGTFYVVSLLVKQACPTRADLLTVDSSPDGAVRDERGAIIGVRGFVM
jgi:hypothetical protein